MKRRGDKISFLFSTTGTLVATLGLLLFSIHSVPAAETAGWEAEWKKTLSAAEKEGQVAVYGPPGNEYQDAITSFQERYPKIKLNYVPGSGNANSQRLLTERRAEKYLADLFISGSGTLVLVIHKAGILEPIAPLLIRPESKDVSGWYGKKHHYADAENQYIVMMQGNVQTDLGAYNATLVSPAEIKSFWDILNPKWKGKMAAFDPRDRGHIQRMRALYYNPALGGEFLQRLFGEMDLTLGRDQRQLLDWVAGGKFRIYLFATSSDVDDAKKKGLPVGLLYGLPEEGYISGGFGHLAVVSKAPHPNATKVFVNWILSREGQLQWQKRSDNNSLRMDIPKDMLTDQLSIPKEGVKYLNPSLPQYSDVTPVLKIVEATLGKAGK
ncbi:MAG TPA: extracellular solute-binding protein [Candidatus Binatia bacterium]|jgi:ABC-type Fe3+ transport system substrate-binding protein